MSRPIFKTPKELEDAVDRWIEVLDLNENRPSITRLAYSLGFASRQSLYDYEKREEYSYIIKRAKLFVEMSYEDDLRTQYSSGSIFALKNMGWTDKQEVEQTTTIKNMGISFHEPSSS